ncbi:MAG: HAD hydrolase family protein [Anaerolineae bacterium]|nr:HAD hydrolase family protein [Anaerolineae bacterium]
MPFGLVTGRQYDFVAPYARAWGPAHVVCNGACLVDAAGNVLEQALIDPDVLHDIYAFVKSVGGTMVLKTHSQAFGDAVATRDAQARGVRIFPIESLPDWRLPAFYVADLAEAHWQTLLARADVLLCRQKYRTRSGTFADGTAPGISKASGVRWWCAHLAIQTEAVVAIGDGENDLPLFEAVGLPLAMGNAVPALKAAAQQVVPDVDRDGVAWAIAQVWGNGQ